MRNTRGIIGNRIDEYVCDEFNLASNDLDIRFKVRGHRYRIRQFTTLWTILRGIEIIACAAMLYTAIVGMIIIGSCVGGV